MGPVLDEGQDIDDHHGAGRHQGQIVEGVGKDIGPGRKGVKTDSNGAEEVHHRRDDFHDDETAQGVVNRGLVVVLDPEIGVKENHQDQGAGLEVCIVDIQLHPVLLSSVGIYIL